MKKLLITAAVAMAIASPFTASGYLLIDHFLVGQPGGTHISAQQSAPFATSSELAIGDAWGDVRTTSIQWDSGDSTPASIAADNNPPTSVMGFSSKVGNAGTLSLDYNGYGAGFAPTDFTQSGNLLGIWMRFLENDLGGVSVQAFLVDSGNQAVAMQISNIGQQQVFFPYAAFSGSATFDITQVTRVAFNIIGVENVDLNIDFIEARDRPELPDTAGTITLLSMALAFLGIARWKIKQ